MLDEFYLFLANSSDPTLRKARVALLKGRKNYVSKPSLDWLVQSYIGDAVRHARMKEFESFVDKCNGDLDFIRGNGHVPDFLTADDIESLALPEGIDKENDYYLNRAKEAAKDAHVVITNHFLILSCVQLIMLKQKPFLNLEYMFIDEADTFISSAYSSLANSVALRSIKQHLKYLSQQVAEESFHGAKALGKRVGQTMSAISEITGTLQGIGQKLKDRGQKELYIRHLDSYVESDRPIVRKVHKQIKAVADLLDDLKSTKFKKHFTKVITKHVAMKLDDSVMQLRRFLEGFDEKKHHRDTYFIVTFSREHSYPSFGRVTPSVGGLLYTFLWKQAKTVIFTSGTLIAILTQAMRSLPVRD